MGYCSCLPVHERVCVDAPACHSFACLVCCPQSDVLGDWYPIFLITLFNVCDLTGKCVPFGSLAPRPRVLLAASVSRAVFVPAFYLAGRYAGSWVWLMALLTAALGVSNG